jgi:hypothetical protein
MNTRKGFASYIATTKALPALSGNYGKLILKGAAESSAAGMKVPRFQILTAAQILDNRRPQVPFGFPEGYKKAAREKTDQDRLL